MSSDAPLALPVRRLILWRHGRTEWNAAGRFQGRMDPPLDEVGRRQAVEAAPHLAAAGRLSADTLVVSSDLDRAADTAAALTRLLGVQLRLDPRLQEHGMGSWEGLTRDEVAERYPDQFADWLAGRPVLGRGGEEPEEVAERALAALADLPPAPVAVVVTHGGTSGRLIERLLGLGSGQRRVFGPLGNCAWSELREQSGSWRLMHHNASAPAPLAAGPEGVPARADGNPEDGAAGPVGDADAVV
ncbi:histidine phosphatase family protein [Blastococcus sp. TML/M2B]|uniref:histidine phosphatase family protein n=1 Tax=unclassified Blastococcus TaxID=2619396 RepID=UPI00190994B6|nr:MULTISPECIES: histidine phosphatase family protein [unclassified Blastococcus]MBN1092068.1 histidine phosphatase family protein [Blastococcus sp. TML/M2B]MBN1097825.1 histidine phosphatase family protein [Blastococcus sp. TML/C7B]